MGTKISIDELADAVMDALEEYNDLAAEEMEEIAKKVAKEGAKKLKAISPKGKGSGGRKGHYADGWSVKYIREGASKFSFVVHNNKKPGLTHLLEFGHQLPQGGRAKAYPHIKEVEEWCNEEFERRVKARLSQ